MTQVYIVLEVDPYYSRDTVAAVMGSVESAERYIDMQRLDNPNSEVQFKSRPYTVETVTDEAYEEATIFGDLVDRAQWKYDHEMHKDESYVGSIKQRYTCTRCGSSLVQLPDKTIKNYGVEDDCPVKG